jgi:hypothetical protein
MGAFGTSSREYKERRKREVDFRKEVKQGKSDVTERVHNRKWIFWIAGIVIVLFLLHVI